MDICGDCGEEKSQWVTHQCDGPQRGLFDPPKPKGPDVFAEGAKRMIERHGSVEAAQAALAPLPPHVPGSDTSKAAAESMRSTAQTDQARVLELITAHGTVGATADECLVALELTHQNGSARVSTLAQRGAIRDSGRRRKTRAGRMAAVYVATGYPDLRPPPRKPSTDRAPPEPSSEDFRDFHSMVNILLRQEAGDQRGPMTERVMLWLKHLGST